MVFMEELLLRDFVGWFFDFVIILRPVTMYQDYLDCLWPSLLLLLFLLLRLLLL